MAEASDIYDDVASDAADGIASTKVDGTEVTALDPLRRLDVADRIAARAASASPSAGFGLLNRSVKLITGRM